MNMKNTTLTALLVAAAFQLSGCGESVDSGNRGIFTHYGEVEQKSYPEGFYWYNPWSTKIIEMSARSARWDGETATYTKDLQDARVKFAVVYQPQPTQLHVLFQTVGEDYPRQIVPPVVVSAIKSRIGTWTAVEIIANRDRVAAEIRALIAPELAKRNMQLVSFDLLDVAYSEAYQQAVEAKQVAVQDAEAEVNRTVQVREQGAQKVIAAEAEAKTIKLRGDALEANPALVQYEWVRKWNGAMPSTVYCSASTPCVTAAQ